MADRVRQGHRDDLAATLRHHLPETTFHRQLRCLDAEPRGEDAVDRHRAAAALDMAEDGGAHLVPGVLLDLPGDAERDSAEPFPAGHCVLRLIDGIGALRRGALGDHDEGEQAAAPLAGAELGEHRLHAKRNLGDQDHVGAAGDPGRERDPPGVPAHHLEQHDAVVAFRRGVQAVERPGRRLECGGESERDLGRRDVVVDRLRDAYHRQPMLPEEPLGDRQRAVAADHDDGVEPQTLDVGLDGVRGVDDLLLAVRPPIHVSERVAAVGGTEDRPAARQDPLDVVALELPRLHLDQPREAVEDADRRGPIVDPARLDGGANDRVQSRGVAAPGEDADPSNRTHDLSSMPRWTSSIPACSANSTMRASR